MVAGDLAGAARHARGKAAIAAKENGLAVAVHLATRLRVPRAAQPDVPQPLFTHLWLQQVNVRSMFSFLKLTQKDQCQSGVRPSGSGLPGCDPAENNVTLISYARGTHTIAFTVPGQRHKFQNHELPTDN